MTVGNAASSSVIDSMDGGTSSLRRLGNQSINDTDKNIANATTTTNSPNKTSSTDFEAQVPIDSLVSGHKRAFVTSVEDRGSSGPPTKHFRYDEDSIKGKGVERGRTLDREPRYQNPLARAEPRLYKDETTIEIDGRPVEKRDISRSSTFFENPNDPCAILDDSLLEPCPQTPLSNTVDEVLSEDSLSLGVISGIMRSNSWAVAERKLSWGDVTRPARALTTVFNNCQLQSPLPLPPKSPKLVSRRPTHASQLEEMTTITSSSSASTISAGSSPFATPTLLSLAQDLPTEIVQQILKNLSHSDFNSARHACRSWFIHSLNEALLETMLRRGGLLSSWTADKSSDLKTKMIWLMSKRLSRECALGPDWLGDGLSKEISKFERPSGFVNVSSIDFTDVAVHYPGPDSAGTVFTISTCGRFLMAANGCLVYIYELNRHHQVEDGTFPKRSGHLLPVTSIICPRRVLACSMDTSSHRYAVAILLDGRMGLVCDITTITSHSSPNTQTPAGSTSMRTLPRLRTSSQNIFETVHMKGTTFLDPLSFNSSMDRVAPDLPFVFTGIATAGPSSASTDQSEWQDMFQKVVPGSRCTSGSNSRHGSIPRAFVIDQDGQLQEFITSSENTEPGSTGLRVENGPRSLYRNLCSDDDPPRSVAICPQRRCVAFGCSSGIELHWVDALTGQDLNRWFPLTAPSDFLFFLPPRKSIDSAKKLRLISSAARPNERPAISERSFGAQAWEAPFWERFGWGVNHHVEGDDASSAQGILTRLRVDTGRSSLTGRMDCSDHYRAVPVSDGYHILFTDPATGLLCMGSDAPVGGPTKLLRKIWFQGPEGEGSPVVYASGSDLSWGVRVVAGFGTGPEQSVWLFSVPNDVYTANQSSQPGTSTPSWFSPSSIREPRNIDWIKWWPDDGLQEWLDHSQNPVPGILPRSVWPVKIRGQKIGACNGLVDLGIDSGPQMTIWAFSKGGIATVWKLDEGRFEGVKKISVQRDGTIRQLDGEGDIEMVDVDDVSPSSVDPPPFQQYFDGTSTPSAVITTRCERRHQVKWSSQVIRYDADGDVLMDHGSYSEGSTMIERETTEVSGRDDMNDRVCRQRAWWTSRSHRLHMRDIVEEWTGIARIDVEIH